MTYPLDKIKALVAEYSSDPNGDIKLAERIVALKEENDTLVAANTNGVKVEKILRDRIDRLERDLADAYQIVGGLSYYLQIEDERPLDNMMAAMNDDPRPHDEVLPFPRDNPALIVRMRALFKMTEEATTAISMGKEPSDGWHGWEGRVSEAVFIIRDWFERGGK